jgi:ParB-like chromosome segregation protein Spo0J
MNPPLPTLRGNVHNRSQRNLRRNEGYVKTQKRQKAKAKSNKNSSRTVTTRIPLEKLRLDGGTQARQLLDETVIGEYAELMKADTPFPPGVAFHDGENYWLAAGHHRARAAKLAGKKNLLVEVRKGSQRDAILFAVGDNAAHGLRRNASDKRKAVMMLLADAEWRKWSDRELAKRTGVSNTFVGEIRKSLPKPEKSSLSTADSEKSKERQYKTKHGTSAKMKTEKIADANKAKRKLDTSTAQEPPAEAPVMRIEKSEDRSKLEPVKDELGTPLPPDDICRKGFAEKDAHDEALAAIANAERIVGKMANESGYMNRQVVKSALQAAKNELRDSRPYAVCPYCNGEGCNGTTGCKGIRFVTKPMFERAPSSRKGAA